MDNKDFHIASVQPLLDYFENILPLTADEKQMVLEKFHPHLYLKKQFTLQHGDVCQYFNFVVRGCLRLYQVDNEGALHVLQFATENNWVHDLASFHREIPSQLNIDAMEETVVLRITLKDLIHLYLNGTHFNRIFRVLLENSFMNQQDRLSQLFSSTAEERYQSFLDTYPHLLTRLSQVQIAAYLGVTPEFLSRIRNRMAKGE
jgi:CRP/FNR family transcriptional regulator, anaerobic regulatory protein